MANPRAILLGGVLCQVLLHIHSLPKLLRAASCPAYLRLYVAVYMVLLAILIVLLVRRHMRWRPVACYFGLLTLLVTGLALFQYARMLTRYFQGGGSLADILRTLPVMLLLTLPGILWPACSCALAWSLRHRPGPTPAPESPEPALPIEPAEDTE